MTVGRDWKAFLMTALAPPHGGELDGKLLATRHRGFMVFSVRAVILKTALERELSRTIMRGARPTIRKLDAGRALVEQGDAGNNLFLLLGGILCVEVNGKARPRSVRAPSWAKVPCWKAAGGPPPCGR